MEVNLKKKKNVKNNYTNLKAKAKKSFKSEIIG